MPEKPEQQSVNAFERLKLVLEEAGCRMGDLVELVQRTQVEVGSSASHAGVE
jgi:enamine deaminase RidA (YjgF/YER057c/UK114 family)